MCIKILPGGLVIWHTHNFDLGLVIWHTHNFDLCLLDTNMFSSTWYLKLSSIYVASLLTWEHSIYLASLFTWENSIYVASLLTWENSIYLTSLLTWEMCSNTLVNCQLMEEMRYHKKGFDAYKALTIRKYRFLTKFFCVCLTTRLQGSPFKETSFYLEPNYLRKTHLLLHCCRCQILIIKNQRVLDFCTFLQYVLFFFLHFYTVTLYCNTFHLYVLQTTYVTDIKLTM